MKKKNNEDVGFIGEIIFALIGFIVFYFLVHNFTDNVDYSQVDDLSEYELNKTKK